jgi:hypothetical protein
VALGMQYDVFGSPFDALTAEQRDAVLAAHPRTRFKTGMIDALAAGIRNKPETAVGTRMTDILEATVPGTCGPTSATTSRTLPSRCDAANWGVVVVSLDQIHELTHAGIRLSVIQAQVCHRTMLTS